MTNENKKTHANPLSVLAQYPSTAKPFQPLYLKIKARLIKELINKTWQPGQALPSEQKLATELGVSQGTVRRALDELTDEKIVIRRQGRGTFVAEHTLERALFHFFILTPDDSQKQEQHFPDSQVISLASGPATHWERAVLNLPANTQVWRLERNRTIEDTPLIAEKIVLNRALFETLDQISPLPNNIYALYDQKFGHSIISAQEKLKAVGANETLAKQLQCPLNTPLLQIDRQALALSGQVLEWRISHCLTENFHYFSRLR